MISLYLVHAWVVEDAIIETAQALLQKVFITGVLDLLPRYQQKHSYVH